MKPWRPASANNSIATLAEAELAPDTRVMKLIKPLRTPRSVTEDKMTNLANDSISRMSSRDIQSNKADSFTDNLSANRPCRLDKFLERFSVAFVVEGKKAVAEATAEAFEDFKRDTEHLQASHMKAISEKDAKLMESMRAMEESRNRNKVLSKQLMNMSAHLSRTSVFPCSTSQVFRFWRSKILVKSIRELRPTLVMRLLYNWRLAVLNDSWKRKRDAAVRSHAEKLKHSMQCLENEKASLQSQVDILQSQIKEEILKRESFQTQLRRFIEGGITERKTIEVSRPNSPLITHACKLTPRPSRRCHSCKPCRAYSASSIRFLPSFVT